MNYVCIEFDQISGSDWGTLEQTRENLQWNTGRDVGWIIFILYEAIPFNKTNKRAKRSAILVDFVQKCMVIGGNGQVI